MTRATIFGVLLLCGGAPTLPAQYMNARRQVGTSPEDARRSTESERETFRRAVVHRGKWLTALTSGALFVFAAREHARSQRDWNALLDICRSAQDACALGPDGRYLRSDAEQLYQSSRGFDRSANRWLIGAQAGVLVTTALFLIDLHPGEGPDNIPYPPVQVGLRIPI